MEKSKLGISVGLLAAIMFFLALINTTAAILIAGYVLLRESNEWLKKAAVKMVIVLVAFGVLLSCTGIIDDAMDAMNSLISNFTYRTIHFPLNLDNIVNYLLYILRDLLLLVLGFNALSMGTVKLGFFDKIINKHM